MDLFPNLKGFTSEDQRYEYPLGPDSVVFDCGGYHGRFSSEISRRYGCKIFAYEPVFHEIFAETVKDCRPEIELTIAGVGGLARMARFGVAGDWTGQNCLKTEKFMTVEILHIGDEIQELSPQGVDLLKLNIEGMEYEVLDELCGSGLIRMVRFLQVQFHAFSPAIERRTEHLIHSICETHNPQWGTDPFIWMSFERR